MQGRVIVISGTSRGIGKSLAIHYANMGCKVYGFSRTSSNIDVNNYVHSVLDIQNEEELIKYIRKIKRDNGRIDVLICNAAIAPASTNGLATESSIIRECMSVNYVSTFNLIREVSKVMLQNQYGRVICFSSMAVGLHDKGAAIYASSKVAITETVKIFAKEMATYNITYNVIAPSVLETDMSKSLGKDVIDEAIQRLDIKRPLDMDEIFYACDFFIKPEAGHITGQVLYLGLVC